MAEQVKNEEKKGSLVTRFTTSVVSAFTDIAKVQVTEKQKTIIANYYVKLNEMLVSQQIPWGKIKMNDLALTLAHMAKLNLDMSLGHLSFIPFNNYKEGTVTMAPVISSKGYEYIAKTYGIEKVKNATVELVYETDRFSITKKDSNHECDSYVFEVANPFNRGKIIGGFGYLEFEDSTKNFILAMSEEEILKYKPAKAKEEFWSGENRKKMYEKTIAKQLFKKVTLDPDKVNEIQSTLKIVDEKDMDYNAEIAKEDIDENLGTGEFIDIEYTPVDKATSADSSKELNGETTTYTADDYIKGSSDGQTQLF